MTEKKSIFRHPIFHIAVILTSCLSTILLAADRHPIYQPAALLPLLYLMIYLFGLVVIPKSAYHNVGYLLYLALSLIKCVIGPLTLVWGDYVTLFSDLQREAVLRAALLLAYEHLVCTAVIALSLKRVKLVIKTPVTLKLPKIKAVTAVLALVGLAVLLWIIEPEIKNNYVTIFDMISSQEMFAGYDYTTSNDLGSTGRMFTTLFLVLFKSVRILLPFYAIRVLKQRYNNWLSFGLSMVMILLQFLFISETVATALVVAFMLLYYMMWAYPKYKRATLISMAVSAVFILFVLSLKFEYMGRWHGVETVGQYISQTLQSYVPGVSNTASVFKVYPYDRLITLRDTLLSTIPFRSTLFPAFAWNQDLNTLYTATAGLKAQIIATIAGGWYIFGYALAPLFSAVFVRISMTSGYRFKQTDNEMERLLYLFMCIQTMLGVGIYNIQSTLAQWLQVGVVLWLCVKITQPTRTIRGGQENAPAEDFSDHLTIHQ